MAAAASSPPAALSLHGWPEISVAHIHSCAAGAAHGAARSILCHVVVVAWQRCETRTTRVVTRRMFVCVCDVIHEQGCVDETNSFTCVSCDFRDGYGRRGPLVDASSSYERCRSRRAALETREGEEA